MDEKTRSENDDRNARIWHTYLTTGGTLKDMKLPWFEHPSLRPIYRALPSEPRCQICYIPFQGFGGFLARRILDVKPSKLNPHMCDECDRFAERYPGGTELEVSILFVDIRGSTPLAEKMSTVEYGQLIRRFFTAATKALYANNALIEKFVGDGLNAFFAPAFAGPNHALTAIKAGKDILRTTGHGEGKTPWIPVGIGINTGVAYVGSLKVEGGHTDITILGDAVNTTARLCSQAGVGEILVGKNTKIASGLPFDSNEVRTLSLKGKQDSVEAWVVKI
jgi:adenylate cyclase